MLLHGENGLPRWVNNPPANSGDIREADLIPGLWTEEPGRLQTIGSQRIRHN